MPAGAETFNLYTYHGTYHDLGGGSLEGWGQDATFIPDVLRATP